MLDLVVAMDADRGIGAAGKLPWRLRNELRWFKALTTLSTPMAQATWDHPPQTLSAALAATTPIVIAPAATPRVGVLMGRHTWAALPAKTKPLPGRLNIVLSSQPLAEQHSNLLTFNALKAALDYCQKNLQRTFVIGGGKLYRTVLEDQHIRKQLGFLYVTELAKSFPCTVFFPPFKELISETQPLAKGEEAGIHFTVTRYRLKS